MLYEYPDDSSGVLHTVADGEVALGWTTANHYGDGSFRSMLIFAIGKDVISKNTAVFYAANAGTVRSAEESELLDFGFNSEDGHNEEEADDGSPP